jgi:hypothetical protein
MKKGGGLSVFGWSKERAQVLHTTIVVYYIVETLSLSASMSESLQFSALIVGRLSRNATAAAAAAAWILKGITPGTDDDNNRIKKIKKVGHTIHTDERERERERKIKEKKGESRNPISWHPQCWMLDAGWRWSSDDCVCVVLKHWRRYTTGYIVDPNFVFFFFLLIFFFSLAALWCIIWFNYLLLRKESRESGARRRRRQLSFTHVIELLDESRQTS